jgi:phosphoserine phosphatase
MSEKQEPVRVAVFDLNQTVYYPSSKGEFFKYICYKKNYKILNIFQLSLWKALSKVRLIDQTNFKENFFNYLDNIPPDKVNEYAAEFWSIEYPKHFNPKLLKRQEQLRKEGVQIVYISGALDVYVKPLFENHIEVDWWASTKTEYKNGTYKLKGKACKDEEKTRLLEEHYGNRPFRLVETYSDQEEDLFKLADKAFLVKDGKIVPWEGEK